MTPISAPWQSEPTTQALMRALEDAGYQAFFVGGCVRNALLDAPVSDVDISTSARPPDVMRIASDAGFKAHPTGIDHGTVTVATGTTSLEVTTFRRDVETDGRRAVVTYADSIEDDALRRDFTMNAIYATRAGCLVDPLGGLADLVARRVRFIEDAEQRIREDYLRILRFFRFFAHYGDPADGLDAEGLAACAALSDGLERLSKERIGAEMLKLLSAPDPAPAVAAMETSGCLTRILPGATAEFLAPLVHLEADLPPDPVRRLAAIITQPAKDLLRLSKVQARDLQDIRAGLQTGNDAATLAYRIGRHGARNVILVRHAVMGEALPSSLNENIATGADAVFPVKAADLPHLEGPALGKALRSLEKQWIESGFTASKSDLLK